MQFFSKEFGFIVSSLKSTVGIALFLILPSIILIIIIILAVLTPETKERFSTL